jgi:subtilisin family serine protease/methionine-rich copper-binding protein CopC
LRKNKIGSLILSLALSNMLIFSQIPVKAVEEVKQTKEETVAAKTFEYAEDTIIVKFKKGISEKEKDSVKKDLGLSTEKKFSLTESELIKTKDKDSVSSILDKLKKNPNILYAEPDYIVKKAAVVNDPSFGELWGFDNTADLDLDIPEAWDITTGSAEVVVAVIDEGIDINHPDIAQNIWTNPGEIAGDGIDNDANGYIDDVNGWDFFNYDKTLYDSNDGDEHGTHVAGTIAAVSDNGLGVAGVAPKVKIMPLKILGPNGGYTSDAIEAVQYAQKMGVRVANNSWGGGVESAALRDAINSFNGVFVASAGNNSKNNDIDASYPSSYDCNNILSVAAVDNQGNLAYFSNYGAASVDIGAPGVGILSLKPGSAYQYMNGTSMAAPHVTGVASLVLSLHPTLSPAEVCSIIRQTAVPLEPLNGKIGTGGMVNAYNSVSLIPEGAPYILSTDPVYGAGDVPLDKVISIKFNENILPGANFSNIALKRDNVVVPSEVSISGNIIDLIPSALENNSTYIVDIPTAAVVDVDGVSTKYTQSLTFSTLDTISPKIISTDPADNAVDVPVEHSGFTINFSEDITWADTISNITINGRSLRETPCDWGIYTNKLNVYLPRPLPYNTRYNVTVPQGSVPDLKGNTNESDYSFSFTTVSSKITIINVNMEPGEQNIPLNKPVKITFNEEIQPGANYNNIVLSTNDLEVPVEKTISGNTLTLQPVNMLAKGTNYTVTLPADSLVNTSGGTLVDPYTLSFTTTNSDLYDLYYDVSDAVIDPVNPIIYMLDKNSGVLHSYNYETNTRESLILPYKAWCMDIGKGQYSNELYVGLYGDKSGTVTAGTESIAIIDKDSLTIKDTIITEKPAFDIIAGRDSYLYITPVIDQWEEIQSYDRISKTKKMGSGIYEKCYAELHPTLNRIYTIDTNLSPRDYRAYNISDGAFTDPVYPGGYDSPYHGNYALDTNFTLDPTGKYIFNGSGVIFSTAQEKTQDMKYVTKLTEGFKDIAFEDDLSSFYTLDKVSQAVDIYRGKGFSFERTVPLEGSGKFLFKRDNKLITVFETTQTADGALSGIQIIDIPDRNPFIVAVTPEDKAANVPLNQVITVTFSENIYSGSTVDGISLKTSSGSNIAFTKSIEGNKLHIKPDALALNTYYNLSILPGAVIDGARQPLGEALNLSFSTDLEPTITSTFPTKDAVNVIIDGNLSVYFSEDIYPGTAYNDITLRDANNNLVNMTSIAIWGNALKIWHEPFNYSAQYTLTIPSGAVRDGTGNELSSASSLSFTTIKDIYPPKITESSITSGATNVRGSDPIVITFNEAVTAGDTYNNITLKDSSLNSQTISTSVADNKLIITPANLKTNTRYILNIPAGAVKDLAGNGFAEGLLASYTTGDFEAPKIVATDPTEGTAGIAIDKTLALTFDENIYAGSNYGAISLKDSGGNSVGITVSILTNKLNIKPSTLSYGTTYKLILPAGAVKDLKGNETKNEIALTFTTQKETVPPTLISSSPANFATGVSLTSQITLRFSEKIEIADASLISIKNGSVNVGFTSNVVNGSEVVLTPSTKLLARTTYTVTVGIGAVRDIAGNTNKNSYTFSFTTGKK